MILMAIQGIANSGKALPLTGYQAGWEALLYVVTFCLGGGFVSLCDQNAFHSSRLRITTKNRQGYCVNREKVKIGKILSNLADFWLLRTI